MSLRTKPRLVRSDRAGRRREVERALAEAGLSPGPRGLGAEAPSAEAVSGRRLAEALARLGPLWIGFGRYLGTRVDLLPAADCRELASLPDACEAVPAEAFRQWLEAELAPQTLAELGALESKPQRSSLWFQTHAARLANGELVWVRMVRPEIEAALDTELPQLALLAPAFAAAGWGHEFLQEAREGFGHHLESCLDLGQELAALESLAEDYEEFPFFTVPAPLPALCSRRCLTLRAPTLAQSAAEGESEADNQAAARRLATVWLRQALTGRAFPVEPGGGNMLRLADGRLALAGGTFSRPSAKTQAGFRAFLVALSRRDADEALHHLRQDWLPVDEAADLTSLRSRLRQAVPFREGSWGRESEALAEHCFLAWRFARQCGLAPRRETLDLVRGTAAIYALAQAQGASGDPMLLALEDLRLASSVENLAELTSFERLSEDFERYALLFAELPEKLDAALNREVEGEHERRVRSGPRRQASSRPTLMAALILALSSLFLLARPMTAALGEKTVVWIVLLVGGLMLVGASRR